MPLLPLPVIIIISTIPEMIASSTTNWMMGYNREHLFWHLFCNRQESRSQPCCGYNGFPLYEHSCAQNFLNSPYLLLIYDWFCYWNGPHLGTILPLIRVTKIFIAPSPARIYNPGLSASTVTKAPIQTHLFLPLSPATQPPFHIPF